MGLQLTKHPNTHIKSLLNKCRVIINWIRLFAGIIEQRFYGGYLEPLYNTQNNCKLAKWCENLCVCINEKRLSHCRRSVDLDGTMMRAKDEQSENLGEVDGWLVGGGLTH
jgi:hypothetical protein